MNRKVMLLVAYMFIISIASAAVFVTYNPEASIYFDRPNPNPDVLPVVTYIKTEAGGWTNSYGYGTMTGDSMWVEMAHKNTDASSVTATVYFEIECEEGLVNSTHDRTIRDFANLTYINPDSSPISCNNDETITRLSDTRIRVVPITLEYVFPPGVYIGTDLNVEFVGMAYGNYTVTVYVDEKANIGIGD